ncbi:MAG: manganese efflux pump MntP family protein [Megasphaera sp.]|uniref:manganese efflux pump MntP n=1 Tax=Megasphaera sp. TaxID=2023260 RepID=UPI0025BA93CE|nr:manganese efflux pump MntP family protein [Megasphaera sp.]MCI7600149.1 manganese efflux pump MntP family protein [Megasphaera sp.]
MNILDLLLLAVGLSMDAFAVSICKGLSLWKISWRHMVLAGLWFGIFQALMPAIGYGLGSFFADMVDAYDHWVTFILLGAIGLNMIKESFEDEEHCNASMSPYTMLMLAIATSIDALAVGVTFAFMDIDLLPSITLIGITTFLFSAAGVKVGSLFGTRYKSKAERIGGIVLILIGLKILLEGLGLL